MSDATLLFSFLISMVISGVIGNLIGGHKDRPRSGFWLGFFFGPIGWVVVLLLPHANFTKCPHCGGELPRKQTACAHCQKTVTWSRDGKTVYRPSSLVR